MDVKISKDIFDVELIDNDFPVVTGINEIIQHIDMGLKILITDWVLNYKDGINYIMGMKGYSEIMQAQIKNAISSVQGVDTVLKFDFYEDDKQIYYITATIKVGNSEIPINRIINAAEII